VKEEEMANPLDPPPQKRPPKLFIYPSSSIFKDFFSKTGYILFNVLSAGPEN